MTSGTPFAQVRIQIKAHSYEASELAMDELNLTFYPLGKPL